MVPSLVAQEAASTPYQELIAPSDPRIVIVGRIDAADPNRPRLGYPGVTIRFRFTGSTAAVGLVSDTENSYITAVVDHGEPRVYRVPGTGDERLIRTTYNPWVQFGFVRLQAMAARVLPGIDGFRRLSLAERAWAYGRKTGHDERTLFRSAELAGALSLAEAGSRTVTPAQIDELAAKLIERQDNGSEGLSHYFLEKGAADGFRCVGFSCDPPMALLRYAERADGDQEMRRRAGEAVRLYIERYLLADAASNPYGVPPYGVYVRQPH